MSLELNRRQVLKFVGGSAALVAAGGIGRFAVAQDATPEASPEATSIISVTESGEGELTIVHAQGETVVKKNPEKIVSFDVASIQTIEFLGGTLAGVPEMNSATEYYTSDAEFVGSLFEPDYEAIAAMEPDLIIVGGRSAAVYPELSDLAPTIDVSFGSDMVTSLTQVSNVLAAVIGKEAEAEAALAEIDTRVAALKEAAADAGTGMVIMVSGGAVTALAPGNARGGRGALVYNVLGIEPPLEDLETATHGEPISFEFLLEHNPDWLFVIDRDVATGEEGEAAAEVLDNDIVHETTAFQNDQIVYVDPFDWYIITGAGIPSMDRMLGEMETAFGN